MKQLLKIAAIMFLSASSFSSCNEGTGEHAVLENIATRTSVRSFTNEEVSREQVEKMLRAGMAAPTAKNIQPWEFIVVDDRATLDSLAAQLSYAKMLSQAPLCIVVCGDSVKKEANGAEVPNVFWTLDCSAATENILLAAHAMGLGAVWTNALDAERSAIVCKTLGITGTVKPLSVIAIGHPADEYVPKDKWKPGKVHYNRF